MGERHSVAYLDVLSNAMRTQLFNSPFKAPGEHETRHPQRMTSDEWIDVMGALWTDFKAKLTVQLEMSFSFSQTQFKVSEPKPMGHKVKLVQQVLVPKGKQLKDVAKGADKKSPQPEKKQKAKKRPGPANDDTVYVCVADLLNHYGSTEQIKCKDPCSYVHYDDLPPKTSKSAVLKRSIECMRKKVFALSICVFKFTVSKNKNVYAQTYCCFIYAASV